MLSGTSEPRCLYGLRVWRSYKSELVESGRIEKQLQKTSENSWRFHQGPSFAIEKHSDFLCSRTDTEPEGGSARVPCSAAGDGEVSLLITPSLQTVQDIQMAGRLFPQPLCHKGKETTQKQTRRASKKSDLEDFAKKGNFLSLLTLSAGLTLASVSDCEQSINQGRVFV